MLHSLIVSAGWLGAIYLAVAVQTAFADAALPVLTAAVAAWAIVTGPPTRGILWAALAGLACDAAGHDRLGPQLLCYATAAAVAVAAIPESGQRNAWLTVPIAGLLAGAARCGDDGFRVVNQPRGWNLGGVLTAAVVTALAVVAVLCIAGVRRRLLQPGARSASVRLSNRWLMLTE